MSIKTLIIVVGVNSVLASCGKKDEETLAQFQPSKSRSIYVTGDTGVPFKGSFGSDGASSSVSGTTPKEFTLDSGKIISAAIQKSADDTKTLKVECYFYGNTPKKSVETKESYGIASVACSDSD